MVLAPRIMRGESSMPIVRYIVWVGTSLLALLFVANWFLPESLPEPAPEASNRPVIRKRRSQATALRSCDR
jgi:hypothetical protein